MMDRAKKSEPDFHFHLICFNSHFHLSSFFLLSLHISWLSLQRCFDAPEVWRTSCVMGEAENMDMKGFIMTNEDILEHMRTCEDICGHMRTYKDISSHMKSL